MAIVFLQQRKKTIYLLAVFVIVVLLTWFVIEKGILTKRPMTEEEIQGPRSIEIDFSVLELPQLKELQPLEEVPPVEEEIGRGNPFLPY